MTTPQYPGQPEGQHPGQQAPADGSFAPTSHQWPAAEQPPFGAQPPGFGPQGFDPHGAGPQQGMPMPPGPYGPGFGPAPTGGGSLFERLPRPVLMAFASALAGIIAFFMGFLGWITISQSIEGDVEDWGKGIGDSIDIPAFLTPSLILSPGWFFLLLGVVAISSCCVIAPKLRSFLPYLAFLSVAGWLGLFVCAVGLPPFISLGAGAFVALIFGFVQMALLVGAAVMDAMAESSEPGPMSVPAPHPGPPPGF